MNIDVFISAEGVAVVKFIILSSPGQQQVGRRKEGITNYAMVVHYEPL